MCRIAWENITERGRGGAYVPARVALQGRIRRSFPAHNACILGMETPLLKHSGGHTGAAPTVSFGRIAPGMVDVVWVDCVWTAGFVWVDCVCGFVCWESGAHEPTPSVLYFCQPRVADDRKLPWVKSWRGTYAIGIVLFKINFRVGKSIANNPFAACGNGA